MKILIEFPYNTHYKTKEKFMKQFECEYATDANDKIVTSDCIFEGVAIDFLDMYVQLSDFFPATYIDFWEIREADLFNNYFELHNKISYHIIPRKIYQGGISIE